MVIGVVRIDVRLFDVHSLKQKRSQIKRLINRLRSGFPLSVAEVGYQDLHQRALIGASICVESEKLARSVFRNLESDLENYGLVEIINIDFDYLNYGEDLN
jgi:uncharacterized protein